MIRALAAAIVLATAAPAIATVPPDTLVIGDSLAARTELSSWYELHARGAMPSGWGWQWTRPATRVVWALGTNDPGRIDPATMAGYVDQLAVLSGCVVIPTMYLSARWKAPRAAVNRWLREDPRVVVADWARWVARHPGHLVDGIHPDAPGFAARARLIERALARCDTQG